MLLLALWASPCAADPALDSATIRAKVLAFVESAAPWQKGGMRVDVVGALPRHAYGRDVVLEAPSQTDFIGDVPLTMTFKDGFGYARKTTIIARIEVEVDVPVAARFLDRNTIIRADDIRIKKKWLRRVDPYHVASVDNVVGRMAVSPIRAGAEIPPSMVKEPLAVRRGKVVQIHLQKGAISAFTIGMAEEDGAKGKLVRVKNLSSNRIVYARVSGDDTVIIDF